MKFYYTILFSLIVTITQAQIDSTRTDSLALGVGDFITLSGDQLEDDSDSQGISGLLYSGNDVFTSKATFQFRAARYNMRGLNNDHFSVMLNGVNMNDPELGFAIWANWGGLNDITRRPESKSGITKNDYAFSGIGGFSNIDIKASTKRPGTRFSQALTNRAYRHRTMLTHNTGVNENGFSVSASVSARWAEEGYVTGTSYSAMAYYLSLEQELNDGKSVGLVGFGAPSVIGRAGIATEEAYEFKDDDFYNPYWGYQDGEKRNSRVRNSHKPTFMGWFENEIDEKTSYKATAFLQTGEYSQTRLNWYAGPDPRGDYYKNLPSYFNTLDDESEVFTLPNPWLNTDETTGQIDWDQLYFANSKNYKSVHDANGIIGNTVQGYRSLYMVQEDHIDPTYYGANINVNHDVTDNTSLDFGLNINRYKSENYQIVNDLLGGDFWVDINQFALRDFTEEIAQNDISTYNAIKTEGDRFGYDYDIHINKMEAFAQFENTGDKIDVYAAVQGGNTVFWRDGNIANGLFPTDSKGESEKSEFVYGGVKAGLVYKISGRQFIEANGNISSRAPRVRTSFISPRTRNELADNLENEKIFSYDISYIVRSPKMKLRATWFTSSILDQAKTLNVFLDDDIFAFGTLRLENVDFLNTGIELGVERTLSQSFASSGALSVGEFIYNSRPSATFTIDNEGETEFEDRLVYFEGYKQARMPQTVANIGLEYINPNYWRLGVEYNVFADVWLDPNPTRRTEEAVAHLSDIDPNFESAQGLIIDQVKLNNGGSLNISAQKSWKFNDKLLLLVLNANNILNDTDFVTGFEQIRYEQGNLEKFPPKVGHMYGMSYFLMARLDF